MTLRTSLLAALCMACSTPTKSDRTPAPDDSGTTSPDSGSPGTTDGDTDSPTWSQPELTFPEDAANLSAEPGTVEVALTVDPMDFEIVDWRTRLVIPVIGHGYDSSYPAPTLRVQVGDAVQVTASNNLADPTTIHWHGLAVPFEMDGVPWMFDPIAPGEAYTYAFTADKPGTYWYHPHFDTEAQVDRGLYGGFVVEDPDDPAVDRDLVLLLDDWREDQSLPVDADHVHGAHGAEGVWTVNGLVQPRFEVMAGERLRLRLINTSNQGYIWLSGGASGLHVVGRDQGLLPEPEQVDRELMAPGDRVELLWTPGTDTPLPALLDIPYSLHGGEALGESTPLVDVELVGTAPSALADDWPSSPRAATPDDTPPAFVYTFQGSAHTDDWMINGERFPDVTVKQVPVDEPVVFEVRNLSATEHPFHLHGLHMELLSRNGVAPDQYADVDTVNLGLYETIRLRTTAHNPGTWMAHCHILPHGDGGMMTVLEVVE